MDGGETGEGSPRLYGRLRHFPAREGENATNAHRSGTAPGITHESRAHPPGPAACGLLHDWQGVVRGPREAAMALEVVRKDVGAMRTRPYLVDYARARADFSWDAIRGELAGRCPPAAD